ncbi:hypothetical protein [Liquorilactobacillus nagelii]|jgi:hypothetical protein|uniref:Uncharacterized protein n=1 Tax=Liquorilactobacillus nagelii TaxID=82688 RepID=A0A3S6QV40_9LACO|nr:hypothetical protein [Liquorilactobacillus nagelii]AUJ31944.1 hypothetical protein BSQ50_04845 [Liquorilactobacillus nagelii]MCC7615085.1 hypothetical protein [Liquorilactobacillus nagelii]MCP9314751.1 hypothetical protein [Liquorilactobacillus nagelii]QYH54115.1 hypothetical protein G6O73_05200 [Liquorilactobacillus nagelii DSM 13675]
MSKIKSYSSSLVVAIIFSILSLYVYLNGGSTANTWFELTNNANGTNVNTGSSFLLLFLIVSLVAWISTGVTYFKHKKN